MATTTPKPKKAANGCVLAPAKLTQREAAFAIYRDRGPNRSMGALVDGLAKEHPGCIAWQPRELVA